ncbi:MAG TPA: DNA-3-methyladenine glycosylase [Actinomycetaceae bacterium]|nr:DNA-3-methyladenine glycosylase [Actinomycetaceae bacterium]
MAFDFSLRAPQLAPRLLGARISAHDETGTVTVRLTEVEAYNGADDPGSHAYRGRTPRTEPMFLTGPRLYVYFTYGMHWCANLVCGPLGRASAVLLRAGEIVAGHELARRRRPAARTDRDLARGPARLAQALGLTGEDSGLDITASRRIDIEAPPAPARDYATGPRTGVSGSGGDGKMFPWRFWLPDDPTVSPYRPARPRSRQRQT